MRILLIDNYDSYTFNILQIVSSFSPVVIRNDQFEWDYFKSNIVPHFDCIIISPGPGRPDRREDFGLCLDLLQNSSTVTIPIFGVCLGHQGIGAVFGARVVHADEPFHGRLSQVSHTGTGIFAGVDAIFSVVRYHSLVVDPSTMPDHLEAIAWTKSSKPNHPDVIMALRHKHLPLWGVQFHPESICTQFGTTLVDNFISLAKQFWTSQKTDRKFNSELPESIRSMTVIPTPLLRNVQVPFESRAQESVFNPIKMAHLHKLKLSFDLKSNYGERLFEACYGSHETHARFWLDSAKVEKGMSRWSYMGSASSNQSYLLSYSTRTRIVKLSRPKNETLMHSSIQLDGPEDTFFHFMARSAEAHGFWSKTGIPQTIHGYVKSSISTSSGSSNSSSESVPEFVGGYLGYFGYEMKCESMPLPPSSSGFKTVSADTMPDSLFLFTDRMIALDHYSGSVWLISLELGGLDNAKERQDWIREMQAAIESIKEPTAEVPTSTADTETTSYKPSNSAGFALRHNREQYISNVTSSLSSIRDGETYEVCLTTKVAAQLHDVVPNVKKPTPYQAYQRIRARNAAPYGAFIQVPQLGLSVLQSSPERFLRVNGTNVVEMKPIKGTVARPPKTGEFADHAKWLIEDELRRNALEHNEKDRAENLMIVDLIRNDLNLISLPHSVHVPYLMHVESYATVHQLVSTIRCTLNASLTPLDAIRASFPPGSMTGAPKLRTVEILEGLEGGPRGIYSGCLGFMSAGSGIVDMSVVIRTAVVLESDDGRDTSIEIGAGGAIVYMSDPVGEYDEMLLKANSVLPNLKYVYGAH
ncbi:hypothetical protein HDU80_001372 [Chytriomyces hyalinus]|nr:hypothetical protein HDU80_001372 [Chytriomyces hyalinus]